MSDSNPTKNNNLVIGLVLILAGIGVGVFGYMHRPVVSLGDAFTRDVKWVFDSNGLYYGVILVAAMFIGAGLTRVARNNQG